MPHLSRMKVSFFFGCACFIGSRPPNTSPMMHVMTNKAWDSLGRAKLLSYSSCGENLTTKTLSLFHLLFDFDY
jgi:hypothetical protein